MDGWGLFPGFERYRSKGGPLKLELYLLHVHVPLGLTCTPILESETAGGSKWWAPFEKPKLHVGAGKSKREGANASTLAYVSQESE